MKSGETGVVILEHDIEMSNVSEIIITLSSVAGEIEKRLSQKEVEIKPNNKILIPLSQDDTIRLSRKTDTEVKVEGQIVFDDNPPTVCKTEIVSFRLGATLNTEHVPGANGIEGQYNAISIRCHAGVIYANVNPENVEALVNEKVSEALENGEIIAGADGKDGKDGVDGKSAYEQAVDGGYTGTEAEFEQALARIGDPVANLNTDDIGIKSQTVVFDINHLTNVRNAQGGSMSLVNGVFTFSAPTRGNVWADYLIADSDLANSGGIGKVKINIKEISGIWDIYFIYKKKSDGATAYSLQNNYRTSKVGEMVIDLDLNYLSVYRDYDGNGISVVIANNGNNTDDTIVIDKYNLVYGEDTGLEGNNLTEVLTNINAKVDSTSNNVIADNTSLATPSGEKYIMQIKNDGSLVTVPKLPSNILYIGNSLIFAFGNHGMASTTVNDDYYAKVNAYLEDKGKTLTTDKFQGYNFENAVSDSDVTTWLTDSLSTQMSNDRQLVIIQLGDNVNNADKLAEFQKSCGMLCSYIRENCPNARVAWVGMWYSSATKLDIVKNACDKYGVTFVDIHDLFSVEGNQSYIGAKYIDANGEEQEITQSGVASHPSDAGFTAIANRIITTLFE